jgi:hypothetical protein
MEEISKYLQDINRILFDFNLNSIILANPTTKTSQSPCFAFSCIFEYTLPLLIATSKIAPNCAFCVLEPDWFHLKNNELYLKFGICMDSNGQAFFMQTDKLVTYFCNFYTYPSVWKSENRIKFLDYELKSDCPKSSSFLLANYTNDKLYTRILASSKGVNIPKFIAFVFDTKKYEGLPDYKNHQILKISTEEVTKKIVLEKIRNLQSSRLVIKPSGSNKNAQKLLKPPGPLSFRLKIKKSIKK